MILTEVMLIYISWAIFDLPKFSYEILPVVSEYTDGFNSKMFALFITGVNADGGGVGRYQDTLPPLDVRNSGGKLEKQCSLSLKFN